MCLIYFIQSQPSFGNSISLLSCSALNSLLMCSASLPNASSMYGVPFSSYAIFNSSITSFQHPFPVPLVLVGQKWRVALIQSNPVEQQYIHFLGHKPLACMTLSFDIFNRSSISHDTFPFIILNVLQACSDIRFRNMQLLIRLSHHYSPLA